MSYTVRNNRLGDWPLFGFLIGGLAGAVGGAYLMSSDEPSTIGMLEVLLDTGVVLASAVVGSAASAWIGNGLAVGSNYLGEKLEWKRLELKRHSQNR
jgi:hypothetical protein